METLAMNKASGVSSWEHVFHPPSSFLIIPKKTILLFSVCIFVLLFYVLGGWEMCI